MALDKNELQQLAAMLGEVLSPRIREAVAANVTVRVDALAVKLHEDINSAIEGLSASLAASQRERDETQAKIDAEHKHAQDALAAVFANLQSYAGNRDKHWDEQLISLKEDIHGQIEATNKRTDAIVQESTASLTASTAKALAQSTQAVLDKLKPVEATLEALPEPEHFTLVDEGEFSPAMREAMEIATKQVIIPIVDGFLHPVLDKLSMIEADAKAADAAHSASELTLADRINQALRHGSDLNAEARKAIDDASKAAAEAELGLDAKQQALAEKLGVAEQALAVLRDAQAKQLAEHVATLESQKSGFEKFVCDRVYAEHLVLMPMFAKIDDRLELANQAIDTAIENHKHEDTVAAVEAVVTQVAKVANDVERNSGAVVELSERIGNLVARGVEIADRVAANETEVAKQFVTVKSNVDGWVKYVDGWVKYVEDLSGTVAVNADAAQASFTELRGEVATQLTDVETAANEQLTNLRTEVSKLDGRIAATASAVEQAKSYSDKLDQQVLELRTAEGVAVGHINAIWAEHAELKRSVATLDERVVSDAVVTAKLIAGVTDEAVKLSEQLHIAAEETKEGFATVNTIFDGVRAEQSELKAAHATLDNSVNIRIKAAVSEYLVLAKQHADGTTQLLREAVARDADVFEKQLATLRNEAEARFDIEVVNTGKAIDAVKQHADEQAAAVRTELVVGKDALLASIADVDDKLHKLDSALDIRISNEAVELHKALKSGIDVAVDTMLQRSMPELELKARETALAAVPGAVDALREGLGEAMAPLAREAATQVATEHASAVTAQVRTVVDAHAAAIEGKLDAALQQAEALAKQHGEAVAKQHAEQAAEQARAAMAEHLVQATDAAKDLHAQMAQAKDAVEATVQRGQVNIEVALQQAKELSDQADVAAAKSEATIELAKQAALDAAKQHIDAATKEAIDKTNALIRQADGVYTRLNEGAAEQLHKEVGEVIDRARAEISTTSKAAIDGALDTVAETVQAVKASTDAAMQQALTDAGARAAEVAKVAAVDAAVTTAKAVALDEAKRAAEVGAAMLADAFKRNEEAAEAFIESHREAMALEAKSAQVAIQASLYESLLAELDPSQQVEEAVRAAVDSAVGQSVKDYMLDMEPRMLIGLTARMQAEIDRMPRPKDGKDARVSMPVPYEAGKQYKLGDWVTADAGVWVATRLSTSAAPAAGSPDWDCVMPGIKGIDTNLLPGSRNLEIDFVYSDGRKQQHTFYLPIEINRGVYKVHTKYEKNDTVTYDGSTWVATCDGELPAPKVDKSWRLLTKRGKDGVDLKQPPAATLNYRKAWDMDAVYAPNDVVEHAGVHWVALRSTRERPPFHTLTSNETWLKLNS